MIPLKYSKSFNLIHIKNIHICNILTYVVVKGVPQRFKRAPPTRIRETIGGAKLFYPKILSVPSLPSRIPPWTYWSFFVARSQYSFRRICFRVFYICCTLSDCILVVFSEFSSFTGKNNEAKEENEYACVTVAGILDWDLRLRVSKVPVWTWWPTLRECLVSVY